MVDAKGVKKQTYEGAEYTFVTHTTWEDDGWVLLNWINQVNIAPVLASSLLLLGAPTTMDSDPKAQLGDRWAEAASEVSMDLAGAASDPTPVAPAPDFDPTDLSDSTARQPSVSNAPPKVDVDIRTEACTDMGDPSARTRARPAWSTPAT